MPFINLIEEQRIQERRESSKAKTSLLVLCGVTGLSLVGCGFLFLANEAIDGEVARMKNEANKTKPLMEQIDSINASIAAMEPKTKTLESAQELTMKWDQALQHLTVQTPKEIYLTNIRSMSSDPSKPIELTVSGMGQRLQTIGEFILRMQGCKQLESVSLKTTQEKMVNTSTGIEFDITANLAGTVEEEKTKKEESK